MPEPEPGRMPGLRRRERQERRHRCAHHRIVPAARRRRGIAAAAVGGRVPRRRRMNGRHRHRCDGGSGGGRVTHRGNGAAVVQRRELKAPLLEVPLAVRAAVKREAGERRALELAEVLLVGAHVLGGEPRQRRDWQQVEHRRPRRPSCAPARTRRSADTRTADSA
jgi:hypothetical protein